MCIKEVCQMHGNGAELSHHSISPPPSTMFLLQKLCSSSSSSESDNSDKGTMQPARPSYDHVKVFPIWTQSSRAFHIHRVPLASEHPQQHEDVRLQHRSQDDNQGGGECSRTGGAGFDLVVLCAAEYERGTNDQQHTCESRLPKVS